MRKHGVDFELARRVFDDPDAVSDLDRIESGEYRWQIIGLVNGVAILLVAYTIRDNSGAETIRIISARRASKSEKRRYEREINKSQW